MRLDGIERALAGLSENGADESLYPFETPDRVNFFRMGTTRHDYSGAHYIEKKKEGYVLRITDPDTGKIVRERSLSFDEGRRAVDAAAALFARWMRRPSIVTDAEEFSLAVRAEGWSAQVMVSERDNPELRAVKRLFGYED